MFINQSPKIHQNVPGINPMGLGAPWDETCLEPKQKENSSVIFINQSLTIHQNISKD